MTNNAIRNRVIGHEHGMWTRNTGHGKGAASGKICTQHAPFLEIEGNVFHDCQRFGMYPDNQHPRDLIRDEDGYVRFGFQILNRIGQPITNENHIKRLEFVQLFQRRWIGQWLHEFCSKSF